MPKPQDIFQLAQQEAVRVTASPQAWQSFLYTAAHNYHTTYLNQLLIHAQRPDAAACASMEYWNTKANRLVMRGSKSIVILQRRQGVAVTKPVFAIGDTTLLSHTHTGGPWEVTDTTRPLLLQDKSDDWLAALAQYGVSNEADRARRILERNVADSTLQWAQPDEQMQLLQALVTQSAVYMARLRIGLPVQDEDYLAFQSVSQFDTCQISLCLGGYKIGKTMYLRGIAPEMKNGLFSMLSELPFDHVITMHVDAMDQAEAVQEIEKKLAYMHKEEYDAIAKARERNMPASIAVSYDLKSKMHHTEQMMDDITTKNQKIFKVCILIHTYGDSNAQLDERVRRICSTVQQQTCRFDSILYEQRNAMNSMLPLGKKWLGLERTLETVSTAIYVPFTTQELFQPGGLYEGINARSKNLILCNRKLLPAPAGMVLGMTGYGKSFSVMQMVTNIMLRWPDDDIVLIDPEQEYTHLVTAMGGVVIDISASSPSHINPMDITEDYGDDEDPIRLKSQFLQNFCQLILHSSELSPQERTFIDVAAGLTYQRYMANPKREEMPTLHDFYRNLALQGEEVKPLLTALKLYVSGSMDLFAHQTNVNVQNHCICFNTVKLGKSMQSIGMLTVLDQVWNRITRNRVLGRRTWVFTDEFQQLLGNKDCTDFYFQLSSRARKWGAILTSITQHVRSVLDNEDARRMLSDCGYIKLLNQSPDDANDLARLLHISNEEKRYIENAEVGSGLLIVSKTVVPFNNDFPKDTELFRLMDTSPNRKS